jgi:hypothetical protein
LAVPAGTARTEAFAAEARVSGRAVAALGLARRAAGQGGTTGTIGSTVPDGATGSDGAPIAWNPQSFASARAAIIEAETALGGRLDELVVFADPPAGPGRLADLSPGSVELAALEWAAGYTQLIREAARRFEDTGSGSIVLVIAQAERGPLGAMAAGALAGLAEGVAASGPGTVRFIAIKDESDQPDLLARYVVKSLDEPSRDAGRVQRFSGRSGLFGR